MSLNLQKINPDDFYQELVEKLNANFTAIDNSNGGPEGPSGPPGIAGLPGPRGPIGKTGEQGPKGSVWHYATNTTSLPSSNVLDGDFAIAGNTGEYFARESGQWIKKGTFNFSQGVSIDFEENVYNSSYEKINSSLKTLINSKTNQSLTLTNFDRPDEDLGVQIPNADSPGDSYPLTQGDDVDNLDLYQYKLKIYNSGNSEDDSEQIYGRHIHLGNSFAMKQKEGWLKTSGFTISNDLSIENIDDSADGVEILKFNGITSGSPGHLHRVEFDNMDLWAGGFRVFKSGKISLGHTNTYIPSVRLDVNGGIKISDTNITAEGTIRYSNTKKFQGYNGNAWIDLDLTTVDVLNTLANDITAFKNKIIRTDANGGVVLGNMSIATTPITGAIRFNQTTKDFEGYDGTRWVILNNKILLDIGNSGGSGSGSGSGSGGDSGGGLVDSEGNQVTAKIAVNSNSTTEAGPLVYQGVIFTSEDDTLEISQEVVDSKFARINLSAKGQFSSTDSKGNPVAVNSIDITSDTIEVNRSVNDGVLTYDLKLENTESFKDAIANSIDLRSSDGTILADPPSGDNKYWNLRINEKVLGALNSNAGIIGSDIGSALSNISKYQISANRYTQNVSDVRSTSYSASFGGHYTYLGFAVKDFDENCNVTSTDPFEMTISNTYNGIYHVSARVRFTVDDYVNTPVSGNSVKLVVIKSNTIVSVLQELSYGDSTNSTLSDGDIIELQGSDTIDLSCPTGDCNSVLRLAVITETGSAVTTDGQITISDGSISIHKIVSLSQNKINDYVDASNIAFKKAIITNSNAVQKTISSNVVNATLKFKSGTYANVYASGDDIYFDANIMAIAKQIEVDSGNGALSPAFSKIQVGAFNASATANATLEFEAGNNVSFSLTSNKLKIDVPSTSLDFYNGNAVVATNFSGIVKSANGIEFIEDSGNIIMQMSSVAPTATLPVSHIYTDYYSEIPKFSEGSTTQVKYGIIEYSKWNLIDQNRIVGIRYKTSSEEFISSSVGTIAGYGTDEFLGFIPAETAKYEISVILRADTIFTKNQYTEKELNYYWYNSLDKPIINLGLFQFGVPGDENPIFSSGLRCKLIKHLNSITSEIKFGAGFSKKIEQFDRSNFNTLSATTTIELTAGDGYVYVFGVYGGARLKIGGFILGEEPQNRIRIFSSKRGYDIHSRETLNKNGMDDLKIVLSDFDLTVKKLS